MFVDFRNEWPPERWTPEPVPPKLTRRQLRALAWIIAVNVAMLLLGPFAGATLIDAVLALVGR